MENISVFYGINSGRQHKDGDGRRKGNGIWKGKEEQGKQGQGTKIADHINVTSTKISKKIILPKVREHGKRVKKHKNPKNKKK